MGTFPWKFPSLPFGYYSPFKRQQFKSLTQTVNSLKARIYYSEVQVTGKRHILQVFCLFVFFLRFLVFIKKIIFRPLSSKLASPLNAINAGKLDLAYLKQQFLLRERE